MDDAKALFDTYIRGANSNCDALACSCPGPQSVRRQEADDVSETWARVMTAAEQVQASFLLPLALQCQPITLISS